LGNERDEFETRAGEASEAIRRNSDAAANFDRGDEAGHAVLVPTVMVEQCGLVGDGAVTDCLEDKVPIAARRQGQELLGENWKLSGLPVMMLKGRPEATSMMGAKVQLLSSLLAKPSPEILPV